MHLWGGILPATTTRRKNNKEKEKRNCTFRLPVYRATIGQKTLRHTLALLGIDPSGYSSFLIFQI